MILKEQFAVKAFPTLVFVDPVNQQVVHRMVGAGSADWLIAGAKSAGDPQNNLSGMMKRYQDGERKLNFWENIWRLYLLPICRKNRVRWQLSI